MGLPKEIRKNRLRAIVKTYLLIKPNSTSLQICDFINDNEFGLGSVNRTEITKLLKGTNRKSCLVNCYGYSEENKVRKYYVKSGY